jgi:sulfur carrier protein
MTSLNDGTFGFRQGRFPETGSGFFYNLSLRMNVTIQLNGEAHPIEEGLRLETLLERLALRPARIAVEVNQQVVRKADYPSIVLHQGDKVEIINFVGGG